MEWTEIIRVVGDPKELNALRKDIQLHLHQLHDTAGLKRVLAMSHSTYGTDFAVVLLWENEREPVKTREGLLLADCLQRFGSVDHAVWTVLSNLQGNIVDIGNTKEFGRTATEGKS